MPGTLIGKILYSQYPHARILDINVSKARAVPGVHAILTARDIPGINRYGLAIEDQPVLADTKVRMMGDAVALVAGESEAAAREALAKIKVTYEELPGVFSIEEALADNAPKVHEEGNLLQHTSVIKGEGENGFRYADIVVEGTYKTQFVEHAYMEPETSLASIDERGDLVVWTSTQYSFRARRQIAPVLGIGMNRVRVIQAVTGGGFGGKDGITTEIHACLLALATKRPVRLTLTREESMIATTKRHPMIIHCRTGATRDGKLVALEGQVYGDTGAYCGHGIYVVKKAGIHLAGPYFIPHIKVDTYTVYTNNPVASAMRGFGIPQVCFAHESQMDRLAEKIGISPMELRIKNALRPGLSTSTGQVFSYSVGILETMLKAQAYVEAHPLEEVKP